ncbi:MAG: dipeptidase PepV [Clostridia bacterium]|nr:dipeptidase PepV [Clostridia bacterium]
MNYELLDKLVESSKDDIIRDLKRWIAIPSVKGAPAGENAPYGVEPRKMLDLALKDAEAMGFEVRDIDGRAGDVTLGHGEQTMGILCHLDVVPAGDGWQHDPWGAEIDGDKLFGRGTADDKGPALCALYAMKAVKEAGIPLKHGVRLILGCDEETGMTDLKYYAEKVDMPDFGFSPDADFPVINIEKGGLGLELRGYVPETDENPEVSLCSLFAGIRCNVVPGIATAVVTTEDEAAFRKAVAEVAAKNDWKLTVEAVDGALKLIAEGISSHASLPHLGVNAAGILLKALHELKVGNTVEREHIAALATVLGCEYDGASLGIKQEDELSGPLTCNLGILRYDSDARMMTAQLDIRYPNCANEKDMCGAAAMAISGTSLSIARLSGHTPHHVPADHKIVRGLLKVYGDVTGLPAYAFAIGGGTYSRMMPNTVAFGINFPGDIDTCHMPDEYIDLNKMMTAVKVFAHAIAALAGGEIE